jgi:hypothetical protein
MRFAGLLLLISGSCLFAQSDRACHDVGGGITTNFVDTADTLGTATGDLAGGLGVHVVGQEAGPNGSIVLTVHHHWVTVTGDTVSLDEAKATLFPTPVPGFYAAIYLDGVDVNGAGTGKLAGASGKIYAWGAVDLNKEQLTLRYSGHICHDK